jgi:hypothetical protein
MRFALSICFAGCVAFGVCHPEVMGQPKYGVTVRTVNRSALAKVKTYEWTEGQPSFDKNIDALIVAAVDRELAARGLTKPVTERGELEVSYRSLNRTDVAVTKDKKDGNYRESAVGTLIVDVTDRVSHSLLFGVRMDTPIDNDPATLEATINAAVAAMFERYPAPAPPKR